MVVQLVRIPACHAGGREFESRPYRRKQMTERLSAFFIESIVPLSREDKGNARFWKTISVQIRAYRQFRV